MSSRRQVGLWQQCAVVYNASMGLPLGNRRYTVEEYLRYEQDAQEKHEYRNGEIVAMAGGTENHSLITTNVIGELRNALEGKPCRVYDSNLRVRSAQVSLYTYPDALVICGKTEFDPNDRQTVTNPRVIVEVVSPSSEAYDRGAKLRSYLLLESLQEYILVSQDMRRIETYFRQPDGAWLFSATREEDESIQLRSLGVELKMSQVYRDVEIPTSEAPLPK